ncbi:hypothetical protein M378DRAFT_163930, partial [Amanita muscaria Koide BX008]
MVKAVTSALSVSGYSSSAPCVTSVGHVVLAIRPRRAFHEQAGAGNTDRRKIQTTTIASDQNGQPPYLDSAIYMVFL